MANEDSMRVDTNEEEVFDSMVSLNHQSRGLLINNHKNSIVT